VTLITTGNSTSRRISAAYTPPHGASFQSSHTQMIWRYVRAGSRQCTIMSKGSWARSGSGNGAPISFGMLSGPMRMGRILCRFSGSYLKIIGKAVPAAEGSAIFGIDTEFRRER